MSKSEVVRIKIEGNVHEIAKLQFDQSNWMIHQDDWNTVFEYCPNLMVAVTGKGEYLVKKEKEIRWQKRFKVKEGSGRMKPRGFTNKPTTKSGELIC